MSLRRITFNTAAMSSVTVLRIGMQLLIVPVLARMLSPADYGLVAMAMPFIFFAMMFADAGLGISLVRTSAQDRSAWSTSFWFSVVAGSILTLIIFGTGYAAATFFAEPRLGPVVAALSLVVLLQAVATIPGIALQQQHRFKVIAIIEICAMVISTLAALTAALLDGGVWALVVQQLAHYITKLILTVCYSHFRPRLIWNLADIREHLVFGRNFVGANFINFITQYIDNFAIGKVLGAAPVGMYSMAFLFARLPSRIVSGPLQLVIYPHFAQSCDDRIAIRRMFMLMTRIISIVIFPSMGLVAAAYLPVFTLILSGKWAASGHIFQIVAPAVALQTVMGLRGTVVMALGRSDIILRQAIEYGVLWGITLLLSVSSGIEAVAVAFDIAVFLYIPRSLMLALPLIELPVRTYLRALAEPVIVTLFCIGIYLGWGESFSDIGKLCLAAALMLGAIVASAGLQLRALLADFRLVSGRAVEAQSPANSNLDGA